MIPSIISAKETAGLLALLTRTGMSKMDLAFWSA